MNNFYKQGNILYDFLFVEIVSLEYVSLFLSSCFKLLFLSDLLSSCLYGLLVLSRRGGAEISLSSAHFHLSLSVQVRCPWFWNSTAWPERKSIFPQRKNRWILLAGWVERHGPCLSVRRKQGRTGRELHALFASELSHVTASSTKRWGAGSLNTSLRWVQNCWLGLDGILPVSKSMISVKPIFCSHVWMFLAASCICDTLHDSPSLSEIKSMSCSFNSFLHSSILTFRSTHCECASSWTLCEKNGWSLLLRGQPLSVLPFPRVEKPANHSGWGNESQKADCDQWTERSCRSGQ